MKIKTRVMVIWGVVILVFAALVPTYTESAEKYPSRTITFVVGFPPGGSTDLTGRVISEMLKNKLGQAVIVDNRDGASGIIAASYVASCQGDGYTLLWAPEYDTTTKLLLEGSKIKFNFNSLDIIGGSASGAYFLVVRAESQWKTIEEMIDYGKKNPGKLSYSSAGTGMINHIGVEMFFKRTGVKALHVPFKGGTPALQAVLGGHADMHMASAGRIKALLEAGTIRALVAFTDRRSAISPFNNVPTVKEKGYVMPDLSIWHFLAAPKGLQRPVLERLTQAFRDGLGDPVYSGRLQQILYSSVYYSPGDVQNMRGKYADAMADMLKELGLLSGK